MSRMKWSPTPATAVAGASTAARATQPPRRLISRRALPPRIFGVVPSKRNTRKRTLTRLPSRGNRKKPYLRGLLALELRLVAREEGRDAVSQVLGRHAVGDSVALELQV